MDNLTSDHPLARKPRKIHPSDPRLAILDKTLVLLETAESKIGQLRRSFAYSQPSETMLDRELARTYYQLVSRIARLKAVRQVIANGALVLGRGRLEEQILKNWQNSLIPDADDDDRELLGWKDKKLEDIYG